MITNIFNTKIGEVENTIPSVSGLVKKKKRKIITLRYQTRGKIILPLLIIINLRMKYLMQKIMQRMQKASVNKSNISNVVKNSDLNAKLAALATREELKAEQR